MHTSSENYIKMTCILLAWFHEPQQECIFIFTLIFLSLLGADFVAATVLITFGALLGKTTPTQLILVTIIEVPLFVVNEVIGRQYFGVRAKFTGLCYKWHLDNHNHDKDCDNAFFCLYMTQIFSWGFYAKFFFFNVFD